MLHDVVHVDAATMTAAILVATHAATHAVAAECLQVVAVVVVSVQFETSCLEFAVYSLVVVVETAVAADADATRVVTLVADATAATVADATLVVVQQFLLVVDATKNTMSQHGFLT